VELCGKIISHFISFTDQTASDIFSIFHPSNIIVLKNLSLKFSKDFIAIAENNIKLIETNIKAL